MRTPERLPVQPFADGWVADLYDAFPFDDDVPLYLDLAARTGGRVLEVACGTGRLIQPLVAAGHDVVGVDASPHMLARARHKLDGNGRARLVEADMRHFEAGGPFDLAVVAVRSFGYLLTRGDQQAALAAIGQHLRPGGVVALDLLHPRPSWLMAPPGSVGQDLCQPRPDGSVVMRTETVVRTDLAEQVRVTRSAYEVVHPDGRVSKRIVEWPARYTFRFEAEHLLERAGFDIEAVHGGYCGEPFTAESTTLLLLARRPGR